MGNLLTSGRYDRVKAVQKTGETTRDMWHKADWDKVAEDPKSVQMPREDWIFMHDAEKHAEDVFEDTLKRVRGLKNESNGSVSAVPAEIASTGLDKTAEITVQG